MRLKVFLFITCVLLSIMVCGCDTKLVLVVSLGGLSSTDIHDVVEAAAGEYGYPLREGENWYQDQGDLFTSDGDAERISDAIDTLVSINGGDRSSLSLLVVGKSSGGVLAWNTLRHHYDDIDDFHRASLVLVDPHGNVTHDGLFGAYDEDHDLWWPGDWSSDTDIFRVYNIFQHESWITGANFPDDRVFVNCQLAGVDHDNITSNDCTSRVIYQALEYAHSGETDRSALGCLECLIET
jgi:hypothetical protein